MCDRMSEKISIYDSAAVDRLRAELKFEPRRLRALRTAFFKKFRGVEAALGGIAEGVREEFARRVEFHPLAVEQAFDSRGRRRNETGAANRGRAVDRIGHHADGHRPGVALRVVASRLCGRVRLLCHRPDGHRPEPLARPRFSIKSCSPANDWHAKGAVVRNIVFMGMGEPFHNEEALYEVVSALLAPELFHYPPAPHPHLDGRHPRRHDPLRRRFPQVNLALACTASASRSASN